MWHAQVLRARVLQGLMAVRDDVLHVCARTQHLTASKKALAWLDPASLLPPAPTLSSQLGLPGWGPSWQQAAGHTASGSSSPAPPRPHAISDDTLLYASTLTSAGLLRGLRTCMATAATLLAAYELAPPDQVSGILEARALAAATCDVPPPGVVGRWPEHVQDRTLIALRAGARDAGLAGSLPPRAAALDQLLEFVTQQLCPVMRSVAALQVRGGGAHLGSRH